jgi:hypothetical protein
MPSGDYMGELIFAKDDEEVGKVRVFSSIINI